MYWYADNSELKGIRDSTIPDIYILGGAVVPRDSDLPLREAIESAKSGFCDCKNPIKWNFKDLKKDYQDTKLYNDLLQCSQEWRKAIFEAVKDIKFTIIMACIQSHSTRRNTIKSVKEDLTGFVFSNGLMRYAMHVKENPSLNVGVVLDWPDKGNSGPFDSEYTIAYNKGMSSSGVKYHSGKLNRLSFRDSALFTNMRYSAHLQFADLLVGATREFIECAIGKKEYGFGVDILKIVFNHFRGYPDNVVGQGISVASKENDFRDKIKKGIRKHFLSQ